VKYRSPLVLTISSPSSFKRAIDLKNVEAMTGGKSDPYVRVLSSGIILARTKIIDNNLDPVWDESVSLLRLYCRHRS
jgi:hypothetical protein